MKAVIYEHYSQPPVVRPVPDPSPVPDGVVIKVMATGVCRSDWHGWKGHDPDITLPHVPGHELAGVIEAVGNHVQNWRVGDRVTMPFVCGCGQCYQCHSGNHQVCDQQFQPGFTHWGSFAEYVSIHHADINLVSLPEDISFATAASLGCRFVTAFRAVVDQGKVSAGQWVAIHGCGGIGLSAIMIANALGANVVAIDIKDDNLALAKKLGATATINGANNDEVIQHVQDITQGGAHVSVDALGHPATCFNSVSNLRKRGKHIQVGLLVGEQSTPPIPMSRVLSDELEIIGSHGMQAHRYPEMLAMIKQGKLHPDQLIGNCIALEQAPEVLMAMDNFNNTGVTVITEF